MLYGLAAVRNNHLVLTSESRTMTSVLMLTIRPRINGRHPDMLMMARKNTRYRDHGRALQKI